MCSTPGSSACTNNNPPTPAITRIAARISPVVSGGNSGTPESCRKHLTPKTPAANNSGRSSRFVGTLPPQNPTSTRHRPRAATCLAASACAVRVGGSEFSGMSISVVTPAAAAALVAVSNPSHSVRPGSLMCTWVSTRPGISTSSGCRVATYLLGGDGANGSIPTIRPIRTRTVALCSCPSMIARGAWMTRSTGRAPEPAAEALPSAWPFSATSMAGVTQPSYGRLPARSRHGKRDSCRRGYSAPGAFHTAIR